MCIWEQTNMSNVIAYSVDEDDWEIQLQRHHSTQLELCDRLEKLADGLPENYDAQECLAISWRIFPIIKAAHQFEEQVLFPKLSPPQNECSEITRSVERLQFEHWEDESFAEELSTALRQLVSHPGSANIEKLSYMLRGFFEGLRRHIAFEAEHILPILRSTAA